MLKYVIGINLPFLVAGAIIYFSFLKNLRKSVQSVGKIRCRWNTRFEMEFVENRIIMLVLLLYLAFNLYLLIKFPDRISSYSFPGILFLFFGFYPRWEVQAGEEGIALRGKGILWKDLEKYELHRAGRRWYLELYLKSSEGAQRIKVKIPSRCRKFFERHKKISFS